MQYDLNETLTREQAVAIADSNWHETVTPHEAFKRQLYQDRLIMPFDKFQEYAESTLKRPVFTHSFAFPDILKANLAQVESEINGEN